MKCLNCDKEFEPKRPTAKFCSDNCRVKHHRKVGKKDLIKPFQMQALYNDIKEMLAKSNVPIEYVNPISQKEQAAIYNQTHPDQHTTVNTVSENSYEAFYAMIAGARVYADLNKIVAKIERSDLVWKQKQALKELATQKSQNMYTD